MGLVKYMTAAENRRLIVIECRDSVLRSILRLDAPADREVYDMFYTGHGKLTIG